MLTNAEKLYLKYYDNKFDNLSVEEIEEQADDLITSINNLRPGTEAQLGEITKLIELVYYAGLKQANNDGHFDNVCFMVSGTAYETGRLSPMPKAVAAFLQEERINHFFASFGDEDYMAFTDIDPTSELGMNFRTSFSTTNTAPRIARRDYVEANAC